MIKKLVPLCALAVVLIPAAWAASATWTVSTSIPYNAEFYYDQDVFSAGTVFTASVSGFGPGNGISFAQDANTGVYKVFVGPGTGSAQSFSGSGSSSALSAATLITYGVSATSNNPGSYCTSTLTATW